MAELPDEPDVNPSAAKKETSHATLRSLVVDLFEPKAAVYWLDFLFHVTVGWTAFIYALEPTLTAWQHVALVVISSLALFRSAVFTHELVHLRRDRIPGFRLLWDALCGVPLLIPSFMYDGVHQEHHFRSHYGTYGDGEYLPFSRSRALIVWYLISHAVVPGLLMLRFAVVGPLSWGWPRLRELVLVRMSSLSIDPAYRRTLPDQIPTNWVVQEVACGVYVWSVMGLILYDWIPIAALWQWYVMTLLVLTLNGVRTLVAHRYRN
ncbi:MAG: fatty acid desaturase, partial [Saprospiraceae bacterium]|nr:fatty acid desaturase [Saprospiraceae bacterium]